MELNEAQNYDIQNISLKIYDKYCRMSGNVYLSQK